MMPIRKDATEFTRVHVRTQPMKWIRRALDKMAKQTHATLIAESADAKFPPGIQVCLEFAQKRHPKLLQHLRKLHLECRRKNRVFSTNYLGAVLPIHLSLDKVEDEMRLLLRSKLMEDFRASVDNLVAEYLGPAKKGGPMA